MKQYLNAARLVTKIKMLRSGRVFKSFLVVEGNTDSRLYGKFINEKTCEVVIADSKSNVIQCIETCDKEKLQGIVGIIDADFWRLEHQHAASVNLFLTDYHDLECMLINSLAYENVLSEYASKNKYMRFEERKKNSLKIFMLENAAKIGYLRWYSLLNNLGLRFSDLNFNHFVSQTELEVDMIKLIEYVLVQSKKQGVLKTEKVLKEVERLAHRQHNLWDVCCGHDLIEILSIGFIHIFGEYNAKNLFPGNLEGSFRLAYAYDYFLNTDLCQYLITWQKQNGNYRILVDKAIY
ncbi:MAG: hypothetical protein K0S71_685 [Clostridia bacterium]|nr:hypothetical protein [Clostridia bacterium]